MGVSKIPQTSARVLKGTFSKSLAAHDTTPVGTITLPEGRWLVISRMELSASGTSVYNHTLYAPNGNTVRSPEASGGGSINCVCVDGPMAINVTTYHNITNGCTVNVAYTAIELL